MTIRESRSRRVSIAMFLGSLALVLFVAVAAGLLAERWMFVVLLSFLAFLFIMGADSCPRCGGKLGTPYITWSHSPDPRKHGINFCQICGASVTGFAKKGRGFCPQCEDYLFDSGNSLALLPVEPNPSPKNYCRHCGISFDAEIRRGLTTRKAELRKKPRSSTK